MTGNALEKKSDLDFMPAFNFKRYTDRMYNFNILVWANPGFLHLKGKPYLLGQLCRIENNDYVKVCACFTWHNHCRISFCRQPVRYLQLCFPGGTWSRRGLAGWGRSWRLRKCWCYGGHRLPIWGPSARCVWPQCGRSEAYWAGFPSGYDRTWSGGKTFRFSVRTMAGYRSSVISKTNSFRSIVWSKQSSYGYVSFSEGAAQTTNPDGISNAAGTQCLSSPTKPKNITCQYSFATAASAQLRGGQQASYTSEKFN